jgi:predicted CXXCH cytochrome family protein
MKLRLITGVFVAVALMSGGAARAAISGTQHDLRTYNGISQTQICIFCHTPHNAATTQLAPLWNHTSTTTATFSTYTSATLNATGLGQPAGTSKACMSCHDGSVALDSFGGVTGTHNFLAGSGGNLGTDLSNDHPVSFTYDTALATADGGLVTPASASLVVAGIPLFSGKVECASCHAVHDNTNAPFLRSSNAASALCLKCHNN